MGRGLSELQRWILWLATEQASVRPLDVLDGWYHLPIRQPVVRDHWREFYRYLDPTGQEVLDHYRVTLTSGHNVETLLEQFGNLDWYGEGHRIFESTAFWEEAKEKVTRAYRADDTAARRAITRLEARGYLEREAWPEKDLSWADDEEMQKSNRMAPALGARPWRSLAQWHAHIRRIDEMNAKRRPWHITEEGYNHVLGEIPRLTTEAGVRQFIKMLTEGEGIPRPPTSPEARGHPVPRPDPAGR